MSLVRLTTDEEEISGGNGYDLESTFLRRRVQIIGEDFPSFALQRLNLSNGTDFLDGPAGEGLAPLSLVRFLPDVRGTLRAVTLYRQPLSVRRLGSQLYEADVLYTLKNPAAFEVITRSRSTGGTRKIVGSYFTAGHSPNAPDFGGAIAYDPKTHEIQGTEVPIPVSEKELEVTYPIGYCSQAYLNNLDNLTGFANSKAWRGWAAGQVLYLGAESVSGNTEPQRVVHFIRVEPALINATIGGLKGINKEGQDFLWFLTEDKIVNVQGNDLLIKVFKHWYVERIFPRTDFQAVLGF